MGKFGNFLKRVSSGAKHFANSDIGKQLINVAKDHAVQALAGAGVRRHRRHHRMCGGGMHHAHLVKGSAAAHAHMARLRAMRRR